MKPSTKRIIVYFIISVLFTTLLAYFVQELTLELGLLTFGCTFVCFLINELCFFYLPKKWFGDDVDKKVENKSGIPEKKIKWFIAILIIVALLITGVIIYFMDGDFDKIIDYMFIGMVIFAFILTIFKIRV